jgi:hypothetical protein
MGHDIRSEQPQYMMKISGALQLEELVLVWELVEQLVLAQQLQTLLVEPLHLQLSHNLQP